MPNSPSCVRRNSTAARTGAPVAIVGAGPIGLAMAIDLAQRGVASVVLDDNNVVSVGSRAICWAKRTLEIFDRLGVGERMLQKGVTWKVGRNFHGRTNRSTPSISCPRTGTSTRPS
jgi:3-(3-hydroxy-phenyl)propionate hydroxylase